MFSMGCLQKDLLHLIGSYLSREDILRLQRVSKEFYQAYNDENFLASLNKRSIFSPFTNKVTTTQKLTLLQQMRLHNEVGALSIQMLPCMIKSLIFPKFFLNPEYTEEFFSSECHAVSEKITEATGVLPSNIKTNDVLPKILPILKDALNDIHLDLEDLWAFTSVLIIQFISHLAEAMRLRGNLDHTPIYDVRKTIQDAYSPSSTLTIEKFAFFQYGACLFADNFLKMLIMHGHTEILGLILEKYPQLQLMKPIYIARGARVEIKRCSLLQAACIYLQPKTIKFLIEREPQIADHDLLFKETLIGLSQCPKKSREAALILSYLLEIGVDPMKGHCSIDIYTMDMITSGHHGPYTPYNYCQMVLELINTHQPYKPSIFLHNGLEKAKMTFEEFIPLFAECLQMITGHVEKRAEKEAKSECKP